MKRVHVLLNTGALALLLVVLMVGIGPRFSGTARALPLAQAGVSAQAGVTIPYSGSLADEVSQPVADGAYDFTFALYTAETGGEPSWTEAQEGVTVQDGAFIALLGSVTPILQEVLDGGALWLEVAVRGPGEVEFTALTPRQELSAAPPLSPAGPTATCPHDHLYGNWIGSSPSLGALGYTLRVMNESTGDGIRGLSFSTEVGSAGVTGYSYGDGGIGVFGEGLNGGPGVYAAGSGSGRDRAALRANNYNLADGMAGYLTNNSGYHTAHFYNAGGGGVLYLQNGSTDGDGTGGYDFITAVNSAGDVQFRVTTSGQGQSDVGWTTPAADLAEMLPAVEGLEPGDVLVIGPDGKLARSTEPYQASVAGVYSTQPGFVGGHPVDGPTPGTIPLAVVGVVLVKVSAENGPIVPGDLLVSSSIPGHAMKAGANPPQGTVIGKALEPLDEGIGVIAMLAVLQ